MNGARLIRAAALVAAFAVLVLAGCGGSDDSSKAPSTGSGSDTASEVPTSTGITTQPTATAEGRKPKRVKVPKLPGVADPKKTTPEDQQGGAGDEVPNRSQALITGKGGKLSPRRVEVPPFIAVRVELRSADGGTYELRAPGKRLAVGGAVKTYSVDFAGLKPGKRLVLNGRNGRVIVDPSAEPGP